MRAAVLHGPAPAAEGPLVLEDRPDPEPAAGEVLVRVAACAVCRTDLQLCEGDLEAHVLPVVPGHQVVGEVVDVGPGVTSPVPGERVGLTWLAGTCGRCRFCTSGRENLCERITFTGWDRDGGYAELVTARADVVHGLPGDRPAAELAPLLCAGVIGYRALRRSGARAGDRLGLFGFGASASIVIQLAVAEGMEVHVCTRSPREQQVALDLGATWVGGFDERPPAPLQAAITTAPVGEAVTLALAALDRGGVVAVNAIHLDRVPAFPYRDLWWEREVRSVANVTRADAREFLELVERVGVVTRHEVRPLAEASGALADLAAGRVDGSAVLVP
ncbi:MAG: zinc-dependent alcohol dehydrogenase family protein [Microthrixaceae bacterium]